MSTETIRTIRDGSPGRPPRLSHSSWTICPLKDILRTSFIAADSDDACRISAVYTPAYEFLYCEWILTESLTSGLTRISFIAIDSDNTCRISAVYLHRSSCSLNWNLKLGLNEISFIAADSDDACRISAVYLHRSSCNWYHNFRRSFVRCCFNSHRDYTDY